MSNEVSKTLALTYIISSAEAGAKGARADRVLSRLEGLPSRSQLKNWFSEGRIRRDVQALSPDSILREGDIIKIKPPPPRVLDLEPRKMDLEILFEDESLMVIYKPRGLSMHPGANRSTTVTLAHGLVAHAKKWSSKSGEFRPGIVHRLDKDTEGIVVVAKNDEVHDALSQQFSKRTIDRNYWALVWGKPAISFEIDAPIGRHPKERKKMAVVQNGKPAKTLVKRLEYFEEGYSWIECKLMSGRTHQIRVHLSSKKFPVLNDLVYGRSRKIEWSSKKAKAIESFKGQALIAFRLGFIHPVTEKKMHFEIPPPRWLKILTEKEKNS
jgi:23S rRNA pseudouridine1911/1915/1917 synthase